MKIDLKSIGQLAENVEKYNLTEVSLESDGVKVKIKKEKPKKVEVIKVEEAVTPTNYVQEVPKAKVVETAQYEETIDAPMVGTFYKAPSPGADPFVTEGKEVNTGEVLCILEAMKLMNEVKAPKNCTIVKILVEDGQVVRKGDKLFAIK